MKHDVLSLTLSVLCLVGCTSQPRTVSENDSAPKPATPELSNAPSEAVRLANRDRVKAESEFHPVLDPARPETQRLDSSPANQQGSTDAMRLTVPSRDGGDILNAVQELEFAAQRAGRPLTVIIELSAYGPTTGKFSWPDTAATMSELVAMMARLDTRYSWELVTPTLLLVKPTTNAYLDRAVHKVRIEASTICDALVELDRATNPASAAAGRGCAIRRGSTQVPVEAAQAFLTQEVSLNVADGSPLHWVVVGMLRTFEHPVGLVVYQRQGSYEWQPRW